VEHVKEVVYATNIPRRSTFLFVSMPPFSMSQKIRRTYCNAATIAIDVLLCSDMVGSAWHAEDLESIGD
jgi:hypothetical protein